MSSPRILAFTGLRSPAIKPLTCNYLVAEITEAVAQAAARR